MTNSKGKPAPKRRMLGGYEIIRRLGKGSMGAVYLARQVSLDRPVALKILEPRFGENENYVRRFVREAKAAAKLDHTNIITAIDVGDEGGVKYFVMEYAEGPTVSELLERGGAMDVMRALSIVIPVARALDHAHLNGFVHRDIKPANVILTKEGVPRLCDLGLAKEVEEDGGDTAEGQSLGTPDYISPEQARGDADIDIRSDIYSLGATLYHMITGELPYSGPNPAVVMTRHLTEAPPDARKANPAVSRDVARVIKKMMAKDRKDRYQTPAEVIEALSAIQAGRPVKPMPVLKRRTRRGRRRRRY